MKIIKKNKKEIKYNVFLLTDKENNELLFTYLEFHIKY